MGASLPPKEVNLFKLIVKSYETKQYKKGLKAADAILKKIPDHGETLSMKGLTLNCMDRKSEAYELVRQGLKNDLKSHVCWHVYGLLYRSDREYREAIKCYRNALKIDPDNIEILRDLSLLQAQMRDLTGFVETRQKLLTLKPNHRMNWIGFAVSHHLNSKASKAVEILEAYEGTLEDDYPPENEWCEHGEMLLYKISLLEESGCLERALEELHKKESKIVDKLAYKEQEVSLIVKLGRLKEGENLYQALLFLNPDNYRYYEGLQKCVGLYSKDGQYAPDEIDRLDALYKSLEQQYKWSSAVKRIPLDFLQGDKFREAAENYIRSRLTKGVPSLFSDLSSLYNHPGKADILEQLILELEHSIRTTGQYPGRVDKEPPSTLMWTLFLLAQHYDRQGHYELALSRIDEAIKHTTTVIDLYSVKSRILKHAGDLAAAAALADEARCMDLADRYVNSECVKRMLQADQVSMAEKTAVLFTKDGDQHNNLHDMQCMWYELASGESYFRQGDLGRALKKYLAVEKHYADITEDQFDFHSYCLRKMTLRTYVEMLRLQDRLHSHAYFHKAAAGAIRCYLKLYDSPLKSTTEEEDDMSKLLPSQKKKLRQKQRKAEARAKKEAEEKNGESNASSASKSGKRHVKPVDPDPRGEKLLQVEDPLLEATKYLKLLLKNSPDSLETHWLSFELYIRKQKILLAFQAVKQLLRLDAEHPDSHRCLIKFFHKVGSMNVAVTDGEKLIWSVLEAERPTISQLHEKSLLEANISFLEKHKDSLMHRAAAAEMLCTLDPNRKSEAVKLIEESPSDHAPRNGVVGAIREWKLKDCIAVHKLLETVLVEPDAASNSLMHRAAAAEMLCTLDPNRKSEAVKLIEESPSDHAPRNGVVGAIREWKLKDCIAVHKLLETVLVEPDAASNSLMHRAAAAEMLCTLDPNRKSEAVKLIEESPSDHAPRNGVVGAIREWKLKDCIAVHKLLETVLVEPDAASRLKVRCKERFPYSTYFEGSRSSVSPNSAFNQICNNFKNGSINHSMDGQNVDSFKSNRKLDAFKDLSISQS